MQQVKQRFNQEAAWQFRMDTAGLQIQVEA